MNGRRTVGLPGPGSRRVAQPQECYALVNVWAGIFDLRSPTFPGQGQGMLEVRSLGPDDWPLWRELRLAALAEAPHAFGSTLAEWQGEGDLAERWRSRLAIPGIHLVVFLDDHPAGMGSGIPSEQAGAVELISIWVAPEARGHGVGDRLLEGLEKWAREQAFTSLRLSVMSDNPQATALYLRNGYADSGEPLDPLPDGRHERILAKPLGRP